MSSLKGRIVVSVLVLLLLLAACAKAPEPVQSRPKPRKVAHTLAPSAPPEVDMPVELGRFAGLTMLDGVRAAKALDPGSQGLSSWKQLAAPLQRSLEYVQSQPPDGLALDRPDLTLTWSDLAASIVELQDLLPRLDADPTLLGRHFAWYRLSPDTTMTGYYTPVIEASLKRRADYPFPLYAPPPEAAGGEGGPLPDRRAIDFGGALSGRNLEIAWAKDPVELFYLHVQGSGLLRLPDGRIKSAQYVTGNGRRFKGLGQIFLERGLLPSERVSKTEIQSWIASNRSRMSEVMSQNESYVFFSLSDKTPRGAINRPLTPMVSLATDPKIVPLGSIFAYSAETVFASGEEPRWIRGIGLAQDTGGAIKGLRLDCYMGVGDEAEYPAHHTKSPAAVYLLLSRNLRG